MCGVEDEGGELVEGVASSGGWNNTGTEEQQHRNGTEAWGEGYVLTGWYQVTNQPWDWGEQGQTNIQRYQVTDTETSPLIPI